MSRFHATSDGDVPFTPEEEDQADKEAEAGKIREQQEGYKVKRAAAYPSVTDQLDLIYTSGLDAWRAAIKAIKDKYPKP